MSILPPDALSSTSSAPETPFLNPAPDHGFLPGSTTSTSVSQDITALESLQISYSESPFPVSGKVSDPLAAAVSGESSQKVRKAGRHNHNKKPSHHTSEQPPHFKADRGLGASSGNWPAFNSSPHDYETSGSLSMHGVASQVSVKKSQVANGNHLLNFRYNPVARPPPRALPSRRQQKRRPYSKDLFLQANYRFIVLDSGNRSPESIDPDKTLQWDNIICLKYSSPHLVQCPICLECPLCPQITSCGHIFCFPCILRYLLMGREDDKGDCWKKCPLCFMMISINDLYTIYIEYVKNYCVGDAIEFMLLTRQKGSNILFQKIEQVTELNGSCNKNVDDSFSKFTFTSDVDMSVRQAMLDLDSWLARANSGLVDDLEKLPYVFAAMEQLKNRKIYWNEYMKNESNKADKQIDCLTRSHTHALMHLDHASNVTCGSQPTIDNKDNSLGELAPMALDEGACSFQDTDIGDSLEGRGKALSYSYDGKTTSWRQTNGFGDKREKELFSFYQAVDGQHLILHPLNMKCFLHYYGSYDTLPHRIKGKILQLETITQSEAMRRRYRYLSHFSLTTTFQLCEIDLGEILPPDILSPFMDEIKNRDKHRKRLARKEQIDKTKAEAAIAHSGCISFNSSEPSYQNPPEFSLDDFEALGSPAPVPLMLSSPPVDGPRMLFSSVTKLGFAAGHDSPALNIEGARSLHDHEAASARKEEDHVGASVSVNGLGVEGMPSSFANVASKATPVEQKTNETGKKGKKAARVLLSTAGGRRY